MCNPVLILAGASLVTGLYAADQQQEAGKAAASQMEAQAKVDAVAAGDARAQGDRETERMLWRTRQALGSQRAAIAASGVAADYGTTLELLGETAFFGEMEQQDARLNAARQAWGYDVSATNRRNEGAFQKWSGKSQAVGTALGSAMNAGQFYYGNRKPSSGSGLKVEPESITMPRYRYT